MVVLNLPGVVLAKGCEFRVLASLGEGFGVGLRWLVWGGFRVENEGKRERGWGGLGAKRWGQTKEPASQRARVFKNAL